MLGQKGKKVFSSQDWLTRKSYCQLQHHVPAILPTLYKLFPEYTPFKLTSHPCFIHTAM